MVNIFVFGTLKDGFPNEHINTGKRLKGDYRTKEHYPLCIVGKCFAPWLILDEGNGHKVKGQVFSVDENTLADMDKLERTEEPDGFARITISVVSGDSGEELIVYAYGKSVAQLQAAQVHHTLRDEYTLEHALLYVGPAS